MMADRQVHQPPSGCGDLQEVIVARVDAFDGHDRVPETVLLVPTFQELL
jgi:hypothetical protein